MVSIRFFRVFRKFLRQKSVRPLCCFVSLWEWPLSDKNSDFYFTEEKPFVPSNRASEERFSFFLKIVCLFAFCGSTALWLISNQPHLGSPSKSSRVVQSVSSASLFEDQELALDSFFVLLKSNQGRQLIKMEVVFHLNDPQVFAEVQQSVTRIKDHIVFILSHQNVSVFSDSERKHLLEQEIIHQLNLFLVSGKIEDMRLKKTFLNNSGVELPDL